MMLPIFLNLFCIKYTVTETEQETIGSSGKKYRGKEKRVTLIKNNCIEVNVKKKKTNTTNNFLYKIC